MTTISMTDSRAPEKARETILIVDDEPDNLMFMGELLSAAGYLVVVARDGPEAMALVDKRRPNLVLLDVVMPGMDGYAVCRHWRAHPETRLMPVILVTGTRPGEERVQGLDAGADDFLTKPVDQAELLARVRSLLRIDALHQEVESWALELESRVDLQVRQLERLNQLKNFLPAHIAEVVLGEQEEQSLAPRRRWVVSCAVDLRGFTAFAQSAEPEDLIDVLKAYYAVVGTAVAAHGGTVERYAGDGMMVLFNAPLELEEPELAALRAARDIQQAYQPLFEDWRAQGQELGLGIGLASGYATAGAVGFADNWQYSAIGTVTNLAARLCALATHGQVLASAKVVLPCQDRCVAESLGDKAVKGLRNPVPVYSVTGVRD